MDSFTTAIATAQAFYNDGDVDQSMVNSARITLVAATNVFNGQKRLGTKTEGSENSSYDIYVAGSYSNGTVSIPCYWKNGIKTDLPFTGYVHGRAEKIIVDGGNLYVSGSVDSGGEEFGCYWKNGVISLLSNNSYAQDMAIANGVIYIVGQYESGGYYFPCYWVNGIKTDLSIPEDGYGNASKISIFGGTIYITGQYALTSWSYSKICYWANGARTDLISDTPPTEGYNIYDIVAADIGVFIVGTTSWSYPRTPWYWKNGFINLNVPTGSDSIPFSIALLNNDIYIAGFYDNGDVSARQAWACYWKNGIRTNLPDGGYGKDSFAYAVKIIDNNVYIAGVVDSFHNFDGENFTSGSTACYWENGTLIELFANASANDIYVMVKSQ
jgi:hypothetical protein